MAGTGTTSSKRPTLTRNEVLFILNMVTHIAPAGKAAADMLDSLTKKFTLILQEIDRREKELPHE